MNILIVDDSRLSRSYIKKILGVTGYSDATVLEAGNGKDALALMESTEIRCLFLDINMPVMTGIELVEKLEELGKIDKTEIVITSSVADSRCIDLLKAKGIKYFLRKPFTPESLSEITDILKGNAA